jgi:hypothetical protein
VVLPASTGSGARGEWNLTILHRNLIQTWQQPRSAGPVLRWLLVQLDAINAAGIVTTSRGPTAVTETPDAATMTAATTTAATTTAATSGVSASEPVAAQSLAVNSGSSRSPARSSGTTPAHDDLNAAAQLGPRGGSRSTRTGPTRSSTVRTGAERRRIRTGTGTPRGRRSGSCARRSASYSARRTGSRRTR